VYSRARDSRAAASSRARKALSEDAPPTTLSSAENVALSHGINPHPRQRGFCQRRVTRGGKGSIPRRSDLAGRRAAVPGRARRAKRSAGIWSKVIGVPPWNVAPLSTDTFHGEVGGYLRTLNRIPRRDLFERAARQRRKEKSATGIFPIPADGVTPAAREEEAGEEREEEEVAGGGGERARASDAPRRSSILVSRCRREISRGGERERERERERYARYIIVDIV